LDGIFLLVNIGGLDGVQGVLGFLGLDRFIETGLDSKVALVFDIKFNDVEGGLRV